MKQENSNGSIDILRDYYYNYDKAGNVTSRYYTENNVTHDYLQFHYNDANWADLLTSVSGHSFTYDASGNPLTFYNGRDYSFTWSGGRQPVVSYKTNQYRRPWKLLQRRRYFLFTYRFSFKGRKNGRNSALGAVSQG